MKWYGEIGFKEEIEEEPGVWVPQIIPKPFYGEVLRVSWKEQQGEKINADLHVQNKLSVVATPYLRLNFHKIAYVTFCGAKWTVSGVEVDPDRPRLILSIGPLYLEETEEETDEDEG